MADSLKAVFLQICRENSFCPQQSVVDQLVPGLRQSSSHSGKSRSARSTGLGSASCLDLSTISLNLQTCSVLGTALASNHTVQELRLADCMIGDEGSAPLLHGLCSNTCVRVLDLKGNNMKGASGQAFGKLLRQNHAIKRVCLEWNSLGVDGGKFVHLAEGLAANSSLEVLDLRNNQLSHDSSSQLATALTRNTTLKTLDLRWNNLGIVGGRALLAGLQHNHAVTLIELAGNDIPQDILKAIGLLQDRNKDRASLSESHQTRQDIMAREIKQLKNEKHQQASDLLRKIDHQNDDYGKKQRETGKRVRSLEEALAERKAAFNAVAAKLSKTEAELTLADQRSHDLGRLLEETRQELSRIMSAHQREMSALREEKVSCETNLISQLSSSKERCRELEGHTQDQEERGQQQQDTIYELKEELTAAQAQAKMAATRTQELLQVERIKHRDEVSDLDRRHRTELQHVRQGYDESERAYKDRIDRLEAHRHGVEEELSRVKALQLTERLSLEEQILATKKQVKEEEACKSKLLEDKIRVVQNARDELQQHASNQSQAVAELQARNNNLQLEVDSLKRHLQEMTQELAGKNNEKLSALHQAELQHSRDMQRAEAKAAQTHHLQDQCAQLETKLADMTRRHRSELANKQVELDSLQEHLRARDMDLTRLQEEESQRANALQSALSSYLNAPRSPAVTPRR